MKKNSQKSKRPLRANKGSLNVKALKKKHCKKTKEEVDLLCKDNIYTVFFKFLRRKIKEHFKGLRYKDVMGDPYMAHTFESILADLVKTHRVNLTASRQKQIRDLFASVRRTASRRAKIAADHVVNDSNLISQEAERLGIKGATKYVNLHNLLPDEELKAPEIEYMRTRSTVPLATPGLIQGTKINSTQDKHGFTIYKERDLPFASDLANLLQNSKIKTSDNEDYPTETHHRDYWQSQLSIKVLEFGEIVYRSPNFSDVFYPSFVDGPAYSFTFSWREVCQIAKLQQMNPFEMLAYATLLKHKSRGEIDPQVFSEKIGSDRWYDLIPGNVGPIAVGMTSPLFLLVNYSCNLSSQVQMVRNLYRKYPFHEKFQESHALFLDFAVKAMHGFIDFDEAVDKLDSSKVAEYELEYFDVLETFVGGNCSEYAIEEGMKCPTPALIMRYHVSYINPPIEESSSTEDQYHNDHYGYIRDYDADHLVSNEQLNIIHIRDDDEQQDFMALGAIQNDSTTSDN